MRPDFLDLLPGIFLRVLIREEAHRNGRRITGRCAQLRVQILICERREPAAGVVEQQYLCASEDAVGNNNFPENLFRYRRSAGSDNVDIGLRETQYSWQVGEPWIHAGYNNDFWDRMLPQSRIVVFCVVAICFQRLIDNTHLFSPDSFCNVARRPNRLRWRDYTRGAPCESIGRWYWQYLGRAPWNKLRATLRRTSNLYFVGNRYVRPIDSSSRFWLNWRGLIGGIMSNAVTTSQIQREPELLGQTVVVIGGSAGIGLETARRARTEGAKVILAARNPERLKRAASEVDALSTAAFDASDPVAIDRFFRDLPMIDHVMVTAGRPYYGRLADMDFAKIRDLIGEHLLQALYVARSAANIVRPGGTLIFMGGTGGRRPALGMSIAGSVTAALPNLTANLALEIAPVRVNLIAAGFVDTPLSAELLGDQLDKRRNQLRTTLPIGRVVGPADVAALAVHIMTNTALTGATYDIDGGQQFVAA